MSHPQQETDKESIWLLIGFLFLLTVWVPGALQKTGTHSIRFSSASYANGEVASANHAHSSSSR